MRIKQSYSKIDSDIPSCRHLRHKHLRIIITVFIGTVLVLTIFFLNLSIKKPSKSNELENLLEDQLAVGEHHLGLEHNWSDASEDFRFTWNLDTQQLFQKQLGILPSSRDENDTENNENKTIISYPHALLTAFPGNSLCDFLWEYLSLVATSHQNINLIPVMSNKSYMSLTKILTSVRVPSLDSINLSSFDLSFAKILGNITPVLIDGSKRSLEATSFVIEEKAKRYKDIITMGVNNARNIFEFDSFLLSQANKKLENIRDSFNVSDAAEYRFIGVYIWDETDKQVPKKFYLDALQMFRSQQKDAIEYIFIVVCNTELRNYCTKIFSTFPTAYISMEFTTIGELEDINYFMLLSSCNHTFIINTSGILHSFVKGTAAAVYVPRSSREYFIPYLMSKNITNWHQIK